MSYNRVVDVIASCLCEAIFYQLEDDSSSNKLEFIEDWFCRMRSEYERHAPSQ
jgi:hypothetical protein